MKYCAWCLIDHYPNAAVRLIPDESEHQVTATREPATATDVFLHTPGPARYSMRLLADAPDEVDDVLESVPRTNFPAPLAQQRDDGQWLIAVHDLDITLQHLFDAGMTVVASQTVETRYLDTDTIPTTPPPAPCEPPPPDP